MIFPDLAHMPDWYDTALCAQVGYPDLWHPRAVNDATIPDAKSVCARCPARADCLDQALADWHLTGIWGGTTDQEREQIRRQGATP